MARDASTLQRLTSAETIIRKYASRHVKMDVFIGIVGILPGAGTIALLGAIAAQKPAIYDPMLRELAALYGRGNRAPYGDLAVHGNFVGGGMDVVGEFGVEFIKESARELLMEVGLGVAVSCLPIIGGIAGAGVDIYVARKMTKIVGCMGLIYCENGATWISSRRRTWVLVKEAIKLSGDDSISAIVLRILDEYAKPIVTLAKVNAKQEPLDEAAAVGDAALHGMEVGAAASSIDPVVLDALERWRHIDGHSLQQLEAALTSLSGVIDAPHLPAALEGFAGEQAAVDMMPGATLSERVNQEAVDISRGGEEYQVKVGSTALERARQAAEGHPDVTIISDPETAATLKQEGISALGIQGLDNAHMTAITDQTAQSISELAHQVPDIPILSSIVITYIELMAVRRQERTVGEAVGRIGVRVGSREAAIFLAGIVATGLAVMVGTLPVSGPFIAGSVLLAAISSRSIAEGLLSLRVRPDVVRNLISELRVEPELHVEDDRASRIGESVARVESALLGRFQEIRGAWARGKRTADLARPMLLAARETAVAKSDAEGEARCEAWLDGLKAEADKA